MRISSVLERLREKPKEVRVHVSFITALCVTGVIGLLWGVTLPMRLQGFPQSDKTAQAQSATGLGSFFENTKNSLGQLIGATSASTTTDPHDAVIDSAPKSDAYRAGAPTGESANYNNYQLEAQKPVVMPVERREVRIGTTTSTTKSP